MSASEVTTAKVVSVNSFGIFLERGDQRIFVHLPELSWVFPYTASFHFTVGDAVRVLLLDEKYQMDRNEKAGSIRLLHPEAALDKRVRPGDHLQAKVRRLRTESVTVELGEDLQADLPLEGDETRPSSRLAEGDPITLVVKDVTSRGQTFVGRVGD